MLRRGLGLAAVMGAALLSAHPVVAVDLNRAKLDQAQRVGVRHLAGGAGGG